MQAKVGANVEGKMETKVEAKVEAKVGTKMGAKVEAKAPLFLAIREILQEDNALLCRELGRALLPGLKCMICPTHSDGL